MYIIMGLKVGGGSGATINAQNNVGGIVGYIKPIQNVEFINIYSTGSINGVNYSGGFIGKTESNRINLNNAYNKITFIGTSTTKGYIAGFIKGQSTPGGAPINYNNISNMYWSSSYNSNLFSNEANPSSIPIGIKNNILDNCSNFFPFNIPICN